MKSNESVLDALSSHRVRSIGSLWYGTARSTTLTITSRVATALNAGAVTRSSTRPDSAVIMPSDLGGSIKPPIGALPGCGSPAASGSDEGLPSSSSRESPVALDAAPSASSAFRASSIAANVSEMTARKS